MHRIIRERRNRLREICARRNVRRLALFGSATGDRFDPARSDIDLLVEFAAMPPVDHAEAYFGLADDLAALFGRPVDLVEREAIRNPYFRAAVEESEEPLYDAT